MKKDYTLSPKALVMVQGSSKGAQPKYFDNGYWYKTNQIGYEGKAEFIVSKVLKCSNVRNFVKYEECSINGQPGCRSQSFLNKDESFISFQRLYEIYTGGNLTDQIRRISEVPDRIEYVLNFVKDRTGLDCRQYLKEVLTLDMLTLNTDRHFNNLGIIADSRNNITRSAPIFDNGNSLLSDWDRFSEENIRDNIDKVIGQPFASNLEYQAHTAGIGLKLNYRKLFNELKVLPESRGLQVLKLQLDRYQDVIPEIKEPAPIKQVLKNWEMEH